MVILAQRVPKNHAGLHDLAGPKCGVLWLTELVLKWRRSQFGANLYP